MAGVAVIAATLAFVAMRTGTARESTVTAVGEVLCGGSFIVAGLIAAGRRPSSRAPWLMVAVGFAWFGPDLQYFESSLLFTIGQGLQGFQWVVLAHLLVTFPTGRPETRLQRFTLIALYVYAVPNALGTLPFDPSRDPGCGPGCPANLLSVHSDQVIADGVRVGLIVATAVVATMALVCFMLRWRHASVPGRRAFTPVAAGGGVVFVAGLISALSPGGLLPAWIRDLAFLSVSGGLLAGLLRGWLDRSAIGQLVVELGASSTPERLRAALARALHDPSVELLYWDPARGEYANFDGTALEALSPADGRIMTELGRNGRRVAALVHDPTLLDEPALVEAVGEAARLALENERLQDAVRAQLEELHASRMRIAEAALAERRRLERDLHDGAQQRLVTLSMALALAEEQAGERADPALRALLAEVAGELSAAVTELRELARGIHPALLTEAGLGPALAGLAERAPIPVRLLAAPAGRFAPPVEATTYFVVSEGLTNVVKHARATQATVSARVEAGEIVVEVSDDGVGGAYPASGSGLAGLADRVAALAGRLEVENAEPHGTRVTAWIPCE